MSLRRMDFHCRAHGFFEAAEALSAPVSQTWPCPQCGAAAPKVYLKAPTIGKISGGVFVVDFPGGHVLTRDDVEERLAGSEGVPFEKDAGFKDRIAERVDRLMQMQDSGTLPPRPAPTEADRKLIEQHLTKSGTTE